VNEDENVIWRGIDARLERLEDMVQELDAALRGDRRRKIIGLLPEWDRHDAELRRLNALVLGDVAGSNKGMAHDVDVLMDRRSGKDRRAQLQWGFWTAITVAVISSGTAILTNLEKIKANLPKYHPGPLEAQIEKAKHPKGKKIYRIRVVPEKAPSDNTGESPQNPPK